MWAPTPDFVRRLTPILPLIALISFGNVTLAFEDDSAEPTWTTELASVLFNEGHKALSNDNYREAIESFRQAHEASTDSAAAGDALYWLAFAHYRQGGFENLRSASRALERLSRDYPASSNQADGAELITHIRGELARSGDAEAAAQIAAKAGELERQAALLAAVKEEIHGDLSGTLQELRIALQAASTATLRGKDSTRAVVIAQEMAAEAHEIALQAYEEALAMQKVTQRGHERALAEYESQQEILDLKRAKLDLLPLRMLSLPDPLRPPAALGLLSPDTEEEEDVRILALHALVDIDEERALPILRTILKQQDQESARLRQKAVRVLSLHDGKESEKLLLEVARNDPDPGVRAEAVYDLGLLSSDEALDLIQKVVFESDDPNLRAQAVKALSLRGKDPRVSPIYQRLLTEAELPVELRERAIRMLGLEETHENRTFLRGLFSQVDEPSLKAAIVMAVGEQKERDSADWLIEVIRNEQNPPDAREKAFFWAGENRAISTRQLVELYDNLEGGEVRKQAVHVIGQRHDSPATDFILRIARDEEDLEPRRAAIFWLGQSRDPRAVECLEEIIAQ